MEDMEPIDDGRLLAEQIDYYRARAGEYEFWWERSHQYEMDLGAKATWDAEVAVVQSWVDDLRLAGDVLELACGTGIWTRRLARTASCLTAVDASPEVIALNRSRLAPSDSDRVEFVEADLFGWRPSRRYDVVFFSFWLSHVPPSRLPAFWAMVGSALREGGRVVFLDNRFSERHWPHTRPESYRQERSDLSSGERYQIVKRYLEPSEIQAELAEFGWECEASATENHFLYAIARPAGRP